MDGVVDGVVEGGAWPAAHGRELEFGNQVGNWMAGWRAARGLDAVRQLPPGCLAFVAAGEICDGPAKVCIKREGWMGGLVDQWSGCGWMDSRRVDRCKWWVVDSILHGGWRLGGCGLVRGFRDG